MAHYRVTRQLWARHGFLEEVPDASFLAKGRMACRIYEEELMQDSPGQGGSRKIDCENASGSSLAQNTQGGAMTMRSITYEEFLKFKPCYLHDPEQKALMDSIAQRNERWTALDILELAEIPDEDKLWCVLREELIEPEKLHKFACACAERALSRLKNPDPRSVAAIAAKRAWMHGEITDEELTDARAAASDAAWDVAKAAVCDAAWAAACDAAWVAACNSVRGAARAAARDAVSAAASAAERDAAWAAERAAAGDDARDAERAWEVEELKKMLKEAQP